MLGAIAYQFCIIKIVMASNDMFLGIYSGKFAEMRAIWGEIVAG